MFLLVFFLIILLIVLGVIIYMYNTNNNNSDNKINNYNETILNNIEKLEPSLGLENDDGEIQLIAVKRIPGSSKVTGLETDTEVKKRLRKLSKDEFKSLNIIDYPWGEDEWRSATPTTISERNKYEMTMLYAYTDKKILDPKKAEKLYRKFK